MVSLLYHEPPRRFGILERLAIELLGLLKLKTEVEQAERRDDTETEC